MDTRARHLHLVPHWRGQGRLARPPGGTDRSPPW
jgi:diadenosine tetraphosphate (Ap4A) HIT family hydrolase